jgi:N-acetylneuraminic acid mutarotase
MPLSSGHSYQGTGYNGSLPLGAEVYDQATGTWSAVGALSAGRIAHTAMRLPNGKVLVTGGYNGSYIGSTELYSP